jgi:hypothetical protein
MAAMKTAWMMGLLGAAMAFTGCIHTVETEVRDEERARVEFETPAAAAVFYEALSKLPAGKTREESSTKVALPIVFSAEHRIVRGPNGAFNRAVEQCDTNRDGKITETEARIWADNRIPKGH